MNFNEIIRMIDLARLFTYKKYHNQYYIYGYRIRPLGLVAYELYIYRKTFNLAGKRYNFMYYKKANRIVGDYNNERDIKGLLSWIRKEKEKRRRRR